MFDRMGKEPDKWEACYINEGSDIFSAMDKDDENYLKFQTDIQACLSKPQDITF